MTPLLTNKLTGDSDFPSMDFYGMYVLFLGLNLASTFYQELKITEKIEDLVLDEGMRKGIDIFAWVVFITIILLGVSA